MQEAPPPKSPATIRLVAKWSLSLLTAVLASSCTLPIAPEPFAIAVGVLMLTDKAQQQEKYAAQYANTAFATIHSDLPKPLVADGGSFYFVDGEPMDRDKPGFLYWKLDRIFVSPGHHRIVARLSGPLGGAVFSAVDVEAKPRHVYRLAARKSDAGNVIQLWDETDGAARRVLVREFSRLPEARGFVEVARLFKVMPGSAVVRVEPPPPPHNAATVAVSFGTIDGENHNEWGFSGQLPSEMFKMRFVRAGTRRIGIEVPNLDRTRPLPEIETGLVARHIYRITATKMDRQHYLVQLWDETESADNRRLVKEFHVSPIPFKIEFPF